MVPCPWLLCEPIHLITDPPLILPTQNYHFTSQITDHAVLEGLTPIVIESGATEPQDLADMSVDGEDGGAEVRWVEYIAKHSLKQCLLG